MTTWKSLYSALGEAPEPRQRSGGGRIRSSPANSSPSLTTKKTEVHKESKTWARQNAALQLDQEGPSPLLCVLAPEQKRRPGKET